MKRNLRDTVVLILAVAASAAQAADIGTAFTYQGRLVKDGTPVTSIPPHCDFTFGLWSQDAPGGIQKGNSPQPVNDVQITDGLFKVTVDFGPAGIDGTASWLEVAVQCPGDAMATTLTPRQELKPAPHALALPGLYTQQNSVSPNLIGGYVGNTVAAGTVAATIGGGGDIGLINRVTDHYGTVDGGTNNQAGDDAGTTSDRRFATVGGGVSNTASGEHSTIGGGGGNVANGSYATIGGGNGNDAVADNSTVSGGVQNFSSGVSAAIGGGFSNLASGVQAVIAGGFGNAARNPNAAVGGGENNQVNADYGTIGGGRGNGVVVGATHAAIGGGLNNSASSPNSFVGGGSANTAIADNSTVCGGFGNIAGGFESTVGGGRQNEATGTGSTIGGGWGGDPFFGGTGGNKALGFNDTISGGSGNVANGGSTTIGGGFYNATFGEASTVPGGSNNRAGGWHSFAAGHFAKVRDDDSISPYYSGDSDGDEGTFVWADSTPSDFVSDGPNKFLVRASGGSTIYSDTALSAGVTLAAGGGSWSSVSDRRLKENIEEVDKIELLKRLGTIPIATWNYRSQDPSIRHIGPMGQDFFSAFGVGETDQRIATVDADGVALAAIQGLHQLVQEKDCEINELREQKDCEIAELRDRNSGLEARLARIEAMLVDTQSRGERP